ncbi:MAG: UvrD-helicase domain-containing protein, partial [Anaerolineae bacterium]
AGPGSGKTRVLTHRIAHLIQNIGIRPPHILAVTFTNKAAAEMRARVESLLGGRTDGLQIGTFHAICARLLRQEAAAARLSENYVIFDDGEQLTAVKQALRDLQLDEKLYRPEAMRAAISRAKNELVKPADFEANTYWAEVARRVYMRYEEIMAANSALDFDDLLCRTVYLFRDVPEVLRRYQERYEYLLVDEFQDTNTAQYELIRLLAGKSRNLFAVGDEDQSIYAFRGADYRNVQRFREDFPGAKVILLEQNYRSTQRILDVANAVISRNVHRTPKTLRTDRGPGLEIVVYEAYDEADEAAFVVNTIQKLVARGEAKLGDCAVMYRTNAQSRALEDAFVARGIPYRLVGGTRFYQRKEIKDALAYLRLVHNPADNLSLTRIINVPPRNIGEKTISTLASWSAGLDIPMTAGLALVAGDLSSPFLPAGAVKQGEKPPQHPFGAGAQRSLTAFYRLLAGWYAAKDELTVADLLTRIAEQSGYATWLRDGTEEGEDRWANLQELCSVATHYNDFPPELRLTAFLEEVALVSDQDELTEEHDRATLLTLHTAKGLEFGVVFIVGLEENILPHSRSLDDPDQLEEERRLMYVGVTRAKDRLYLVRAFRRTIWGRSEINEPSRFLRDIAPVIKGAAANGGRRDGGRPPFLSDEDEAPARKSIAAERWPSAAERAGRRATPASAGRPFADTLPKPTARPATASGPQRPAPGPAMAARPATESTEVRSQFKVGERVSHGLFGEGIVLKVVPTADNDEEVTVAFAGKGTKTLLASFAKLQKVS